MFTVGVLQSTGDGSALVVSCDPTFTSCLLWPLNSAKLSTEERAAVQNRSAVTMGRGVLWITSRRQKMGKSRRRKMKGKLQEQWRRVT